MKLKHVALFITSALFFVSVSAQSAFAAAQTSSVKAPVSLELPDTASLLMSYVENDSELKNLTINAKKAALSYEYAKIENGFDITLSTGDITLKLSEDGTGISAKPSVKAKIPQASNISLSAETSLNSSESSAELENTSLKLGIDLISADALSKKITMLKARRSLVEVQRKIEKRAITVEKEFYTELRNFLSSISSIMSQKEKFYSDKIDFEEKKIQGYSTNSSTYRQAELKVISDEHEIAGAMHSLIYDCVVFYKKCGFDITVDENTDLMSLVPSDLTPVEPVEVAEFKKDLYSEIENAVWTHAINSMERKTKKTYSLSANAGYTFNNSNTKSDSLDAGLSGTIGGVSLGAGVSIPVGGGSSACTLSATLSPNTFRKNNISKQQDELSAELEILAVEAAESAYETKIVELQQKLESLLWEKESTARNLSMYEDLERNMAQLFLQGYIRESEYLSAQVDLNSCIIKKAMNLIDLIIYNDDVISNFVSAKFEIE